MSKKLYWGLGVLILLIIGATVFMFVRSQAEIRQLEREAAEAQKLLQQHNAQKEMAEGEHPAHGHFHEDGTFHAGKHNPFDTPTWQTPAVQIPENIKDPAVVAAWKRLADISNNRQRWGNFSPRALELMDELTPLPEHGSSEYGDCGEEIILVLDELAKLRDPRSAELLVSYQIDSAVWGRPIDEALAAMGPAAVPALIAGLNPERAGEVMLHVPIDLLPQIVAEHRSELGGIVEHIIIPKMEAIAAPESPENYALSNKLSAIEALVRLQKPKNQ